ncbi:MAG TPA: alanine--tRNA ligase [Polyangiaceae bacterium]
MTYLASADVRRVFLEYFGGHGHEVVASSPLVPANDPTLMFANAGMVQFKDVFVGKETRPYKRATSSQKVIRISGKHNDLENVGVTARHHTFFEMLGNFSFGDYFKEEAIVFAWDLLTKVYALDPDRMVVTVFGGEHGVAADDGARALWRKVTGFGDDRILGLGMKDNFWQMGDTGPCGPCTEIHWYNGPVAAGASVPYGSFGDEPTSDGLGWTELWNLVFMQFERSVAPSGEATLAPLPKPCVDTGMGLERVSSVLQGVTSNYETDLLRALVDRASEISGKRYGGTQGDDDVSMRVIADHARTAAFLIAEGVFPDRAGREYVLRRVMRRAIRHGHRLGIRSAFLHEVALEVVRLMGAQYPELERRKELIASVSRQEEERFRETIERGLKILEDEIALVKVAAGAALSGATTFKLYDTYGFPADLTQVIAAERGITVDEAGYEKALEEQRARSEGSRVGEAAIDHVWHEVLESTRASLSGGVKFVGYDREQADGAIVAIVKGGSVVARAEPGDDVRVVTDVTPFYGESGGQVGDRGVITGLGDGGAQLTRIDVADTQKPAAGLFVHVGKLTQGALATGDRVHLAVDPDARTATRRNHSATHLLHWALRTVLGEQATQKGSLVGPDRLRFDFAHGRPVEPDQLARIEDLVNAKILTDAPVVTEVLPIDVARRRGAVAIFEEKYGDVVRMLTMTPDSVELCGGTHARSLGEIGSFKILSEQGLAAGVRRIEAASGLNVLAYVRSVEGALKSAARALHATPADLTDKVQRLLDRERQLEKEMSDLKRQLALGSSGSGPTGTKTETAGVPLADKARDIPGGKALAERIQVADAGTLREVAEQWRDKLGPSVVLVGAADKGRAMLVLAVSKDLTGRYNASHLIKDIAQMLGGSGGGRPDMAQAGGTQVDRLDEALDSLYSRLA